MKQEYKHWTQEEIDLIIKHHRQNKKTIANMLGGKRSRGAIQNKLRKLGIGTSKKWTEEMNNVILNNYANNNSRELSQMLNIDIRKVQSRITYLKIKGVLKNV